MSFMPIKIKLCGFSDKKSIKLALSHNPDYIGFVFYQKSVRNITLEQAMEFSELDFGMVKKVAVMVDENDEFIEKIINNLQPDLLQLHGDESVDRCLQIKNKFQLPIIKAIAIKEQSDFKNIKKYQNIADFLLFDTKTDEKGGSGKKFDWNLLKDINLGEYFISGGINNNNIGQLMSDFDDIIIDLSSGIESKKGVKSEEKIKKLMEFIKK
jgi:phosphoribosylanthranilate isomerase